MGTHSIPYVERLTLNRRSPERIELEDLNPGGRKPKMTPAKLRLAMSAMGKRGTVVADLCRELGVTSQTLYRHVAPDGTLRSDGKRALALR
jgi:hypothetical protein